jgi:hypothetical protein
MFRFYITANNQQLQYWTHAPGILPAGFSHHYSIHEPKISRGYPNLYMVGISMAYLWFIYGLSMGHPLLSHHFEVTRVVVFQTDNAERRKIKRAIPKPGIDKVS